VALVARRRTPTVGEQVAKLYAADKQIDARVRATVAKMVPDLFPMTRLLVARVVASVATPVAVPLEPGRALKEAIERLGGRRPDAHVTLVPRTFELALADKERERLLKRAFGAGVFAIPDEYMPPFSALAETNESFSLLMTEALIAALLRGGDVSGWNLPLAYVAEVRALARGLFNDADAGDGRFGGASIAALATKMAKYRYG
jgi:hypothetical protein